MGANVFLSYARPDASLASEIASRLRQDGVTTPLYDNVPSGVDWANWLRVALEASDVVVLLLSNSSLDSASAMNELGAALALGKQVISIKTSPGPVPVSLRNVQVLDAAGMSPAEIATSIEATLTRRSAA